MKKGFPITLADIASKMNVSRVTVSKALRGHPDISTETTNKVKLLAREMGYLPNYMARNLSSNHTNTIGVVVPKIAHFFFSSVIEAMYDAALERGYELILTVSQEDGARELQHIRSLLSMRVEGIIISVSQQTTDYSFFHKIKELGVPITFMDRTVEIDGFTKVTADDRGGAYLATEQAVKAGYSRIAHFSGFSHTTIGRERLCGFESAMKDYNMEIRPEWVIPGGFGEQDGYASFMQLYRSGRMPECIFTVTFPVALGVYRAVHELKLNIPDDMDIISFGSSSLNQFLSPVMSYVEQPTIELARKALELTLEQIHLKDQYLPQTVVLPTKLVLSDTCLRRN